MYCIRHTFRIPAYSILCLCRYIQAYSALLRYIHVYWGIFKEHSGLFRRIFSTLCNSPIFTTLPYSNYWHLGPEAYSKPCETLTRHIQNLDIVRRVYSGIIHPYSDIFRTLCNACICRSLGFLESWNIQNPSIIAFWNWQPWYIDNPRIFRTLDIFTTRHLFRNLSKI